MANIHKVQNIPLEKSRFHDASPKPKLKPNSPSTIDVELRLIDALRTLKSTDDQFRRHLIYRLAKSFDCTRKEMNKEAYEHTITIASGVILMLSSAFKPQDAGTTLLQSVSKGADGLTQVVTNMSKSKQRHLESQIEQLRQLMSSTQSDDGQLTETIRNIYRVLDDVISNQSRMHSLSIGTA